MRSAWIAVTALAIASAAAANEGPAKPPEMSTRLSGPGPTVETLRQKQLQWERAHATPAAASAGAPATGAAARATAPAAKSAGAAKATSIPFQGAELAAALARQQAKIAALAAPPAAAAPRSALAPKTWSPRVDKPSEVRTIQATPESQRSAEQRAKDAAGKATAAAPARRGEP